MVVAVVVVVALVDIGQNHPPPVGIVKMVKSRGDAEAGGNALAFASATAKTMKTRNALKAITAT